MGLLFIDMGIVVDSIGCARESVDRLGIEHVGKNPLNFRIGKKQCDNEHIHTNPNSNPFNRIMYMAMRYTSANLTTKYLCLISHRYIAIFFFFLYCVFRFIPFCFIFFFFLMPVILSRYDRNVQITSL